METRVRGALAKALGAAATISVLAYVAGAGIKWM